MKKQQAAYGLKSKRKEGNNSGRQYRRRTIHGYSIQDHFTSKTPEIATKSARKPLKVVSASKPSDNVKFATCERQNPSSWKEQDSKMVESVVKLKNKLSFIKGKECMGQSNEGSGEKSFDEQGSHSVDDHNDNSNHASSIQSFVSMRRSKKLEFVVKEPSSKPYSLETNNKLLTVHSVKGTRRYDSFGNTVVNNTTNKMNESVNQASIEDDINKRNKDALTVKSPALSKLAEPFSREVTKVNESREKLQSEYLPTYGGGTSCDAVFSVKLSPQSPDVELTKTSNNDSSVNKPSHKTMRRSNSGNLRKSLQEARILASKNNTMTGKQQNNLQSSSELVHPWPSQQGQLLENPTNKDWMHLFEEPFPRRSPRLSTINSQDYKQLLDNLSPLTSHSNKRKRRSSITPSCLAPKKTFSSNLLKDCGKDSFQISAQNEQIETPNVSTPHSENPRRRRKSKSGAKVSKRRTVSRQVPVECNETTKEELEESFENNSMLIREEIHFPNLPVELTKPGGPFNAVIDFCLPDKDFVKLKLAKIKGTSARHISKISTCSRTAKAKDLSLQSTSSQPATVCISISSNKLAESSSVDQETCSPDRKCSQDALSSHQHGSGDCLSDSILVQMLASSSPGVLTKKQSSHFGDTLSGGEFSDSIIQPWNGTSNDLPCNQASFSKHDDICTDSQSLSESILEPLNRNYNKWEENKSKGVASSLTKNSVKVQDNKTILCNEEGLQYNIDDATKTCPDRNEYVPSSVESITGSPNQAVLKGLHYKVMKTTLEYVNSNMSSIIDNNMAQTSINPVITHTDSTVTSDSFEKPSSIDVGYHGNNMSCQKDKEELHGDEGYDENYEGCHRNIVSCHGDSKCCHRDLDNTSHWKSYDKVNSVKCFTDKNLERDGKQKSDIEKLPSSNQPAVDGNKLSQSFECGIYNNSLCSNPEELNPILDSFPLCYSIDELAVNHSSLPVGHTATYFQKVHRLSCSEHSLLDKSKNDNESFREFRDSGTLDGSMFDSKHFSLSSERSLATSINNLDITEKDLALNQKANPTSSYNEQSPIITALFSTPPRRSHSEGSQDIEPSIGDTATPNGQAKTPIGASSVMVQCEPEEAFTPILMQACLQHENSESSPVCSISMFTYILPVKREVLAVCLSHWVVLWIKVQGQEWTVFKTWKVELDEEFQKVQFLPSSSSIALFVGGSLTTTNARVYSGFDKEWHELSLKYNPLDSPVTYKSMCILEDNQRSQDLSIVVAGLTGNDCHVVKWILDSLDWKALGQSKLIVPEKSCILSLCAVEGSNYLILGLTQDKLILWNHQSCNILKVMPLPCSGIHAAEYLYATTQMGLVFMVLICQTLKQKDFGHHCFSIALNPKNNKLTILWNYSSDYPSVSPIQTGSGSGQYIALGYGNGEVGIWNIVSPQTAVTIPAFEGHVNCISFHPTRPIVAFAGGQGCVHLYSLR